MNSDSELNNQITETLLHKFKQMYEETIFNLIQKNKMLEKGIRNQNNKSQQLEDEQILTEKKEQKKKQNQMKFINVLDQNQLGLQFESGNKQELKIQNLQDRNQQVIEIKSNQIQHIQFVQETEKKQKKQVYEEKTPIKYIQKSIYQIYDQGKYINSMSFQKSTQQNQMNMSQKHKHLSLLRNQQQQFDEQLQIYNLKSNLAQNEKLQQKKIHQIQSEQEQVKPNQDNEKNYYEIILQLERKLCEQNLNYQIYEDQIKELQNQISQKDQIINQLLQQRTSATSNDTTLTIEKIEENQELINKQVQGQNKQEQNFIQNQYQIEQSQNQKLQEELNEERRKNLELMRNQKDFLLKLQDIYRQSKIKQFLMKQMEDEDCEEQGQIISENEFLKEWKINFEQLADELGEYEENERNLMQQMESQDKKYEKLNQQYQEINHYYEQAYNKLEESLHEIDNLNQQIQNQNQKIQDQINQIAQLQQKIPHQEDQGNQIMIYFNDQQQQVLESEDLNNDQNDF